MLDEKEKLEEQVEIRDGKIKDLRGIVKKYQHDVKQAEQMRQDLRDQLADSLKKINGLELNLESTNRETAIRMELLEQRLKITDEMRRALLENLHEAESKIQTLEDNVAHKLRDIQEKQIKIATLKSDLEDFEDEVRLLKKHNLRLNDECNETMTQKTAI